MTVEELIKKLEKMPKDKEVKIIANYYGFENVQSTARDVCYEGTFYDKVFIKGWDGITL